MSKKKRRKMPRRPGPVDPALGQALRKARLAQGLSLAIVAERAGLTDATHLMKLEKGVWYPRLKTLSAIMRALRLSSYKELGYEP